MDIRRGLLLANSLSTPEDANKIVAGDIAYYNGGG